MSWRQVATQMFWPALGPALPALLVLLGLRAIWASSARVGAGLARGPGAGDGQRREAPVSQKNGPRPRIVGDARAAAHPGPLPAGGGEGG